MVSTSGSSGIPPVPLSTSNRSAQATWAATCSASFLERPSPVPRRGQQRTPRPGTAGRDRGRTSRPRSWGTPRPRRTDSLLEPALVVRLAGLADGGGDSVPEQGENQPPGLARGRRRGRRRRSPPRWRRPGSTPWSARRTDPRPVPAQVLGQPEVEGHLAEDPRVDHRGPDLGHLTVGQLGMGRGRCTRPRPGPARRHPGTPAARWRPARRARRTTTGGPWPGPAGPGRTNR